MGHSSSVSSKSGNSERIWDLLALAWFFFFWSKAFSLFGLSAFMLTSLLVQYGYFGCDGTYYVQLISQFSCQVKRKSWSNPWQNTLINTKQTSSEREREQSTVFKCVLSKRTEIAVTLQDNSTVIFGFTLSQRYTTLDLISNYTFCASLIAYTWYKICNQTEIRH